MSAVVAAGRIELCRGNGVYPLPGPAATAPAMRPARPGAVTSIAGGPAAE